jgi:hypothetical protein
MGEYLKDKMGKPTFYLAEATPANYKAFVDNIEKLNDLKV